MLQRRDIIFGAVIGFTFGWLLIPIFSNIGIDLGEYSFFLPLVFALFVALALFIAWFFAKFFPPLFQFAKFASVGALNSSIDFGILNILMLVSGVTGGIIFVVFKAISVSLAIVNSYLWNKFWVFQAEGKAAAEFTKFFVVSIIGVGVNVGMAHLLVNVIGPSWGIGPQIWANIGAGISVLATLFWNFFGYKFFVFRKSETVLSSDNL